MCREDIFEIYLNYSNTVNFSDIDQFDRFEERFFELEKEFGDILGMGLNIVEFCPNNEPPLFVEEILPWLWLLRPSLKDGIFDFAEEKLQKIMSDY